MTLGRCSSCRGAYRSLGFVRDGGGYQRRLQCTRCGQNRDDARMRLKVVSGAATPALTSMSEDESELVRVIAHLMGSGGRAVNEMEVSDVPISELIARHGQPPSCLSGFVVPAFCWPMEHTNGYTTWLVVIDQGRKRVSFLTRRRSAMGPA